MEIGSLDLRWLGHSGFLIKNSRVVYIDPYNISEGLEKADIVLLTHSHYDHCSVSDLKKIVKEGTRIVLTADCQSKIARFDEKVNIDIIEPGEERDFGNVRVISVPAYNEGKSFHPKEEGWVGYVIKIDGVVIYHSGDTDLIPEMQKLTGHKSKDKSFVALLPVGGRFTMNPEEALEAAKIIKPDIAIPMHYGSIVGSEEDAKEFVELCKSEGFDSFILEK